VSPKSLDEEIMIVSHDGMFVPKKDSWDFRLRAGKGRIHAKERHNNTGNMTGKTVEEVKQRMVSRFGYTLSSFYASGRLKETFGKQTPQTSSHSFVMHHHQKETEGNSLF
jgi:hypothetical protein